MSWIDIVIVIGCVSIGNVIGYRLNLYLDGRRWKKIQDNLLSTSTLELNNPLEENPLPEKKITKRKVSKKNIKNKTDITLRQMVINVFLAEKNKPMRAAEIIDNRNLPFLKAESHISRLKMITNVLQQLERKGDLIKIERGLYKLSPLWNVNLKRK